MSIEQLNIKIRKSLKGHNAKVMVLVMVVIGGGIGAVDLTDIYSKLSEIQNK